MSSLPKAKHVDYEQLIGLPSEICGFKDGVYYPPKSFRNLGEHTNQCYNGLFYLLGDFQNSKDFKIYRTKHKPLENLSNPLIIQIYISLIGILNELRRHPRTVFSRKDEYSIPYKGKINFTKTVIKSHGLLHKTYKAINELHTRSEERRFLSNALKKLPVLIGQFIPTESKNIFKKILSECNYHLQEIDSDNIDLNLLSEEIIRKPMVLDENSRLLSCCKILAEFIMEKSYHGISKQRLELGVRKNIEYNDFHLNLNRPFEKLLQRISEKLPRSPLRDEKFSEIHSLSGNIKHALIPDVYGVINVGGEAEKTVSRLLIFDAKHKEFADLGEEFIEGDPFVQYNRIGRNDLHQLITYIRTNLVNNDQGIFGFFGFIQESIGGHIDFEKSFIEFSKDQKGNANPLSLKISTNNGDDFIYINILGLRFGSVLSFIGKACELSQKYPTMLDDLYCRLAIELASSLYEDDVVSKNETLEKTLNNCLEGASRSLFYVYEKNEDFLEAVGIHIVRNYLGYLEYEIISSNFNFLINGKKSTHIEIWISSDNVLFVIDSDEDPSQIFDSHRKSEIFEKTEIVSILSRQGLSIYKNGAGDAPAILLKKYKHKSN